MLVVNDQEAVTVRQIFGRYLELGSVHTLVGNSREQGVVSKTRLKADGSPSGGGSLSRGALFHLLRNRIYRGEIVHKDEVFPGLHEAIVPALLFDQVQEQLDDNRIERKRTTARTSPLAGKIILASGERMTPTHTRGANGRAYRYYVPSTHQRGGSSSPAVRLPAERFERLLQSILQRVASDDDPVAMLKLVEVHRDRLCLHLPAAMTMAVRRQLQSGERLEAVDDHIVGWLIPWQLSDRSVEALGAKPPVRRDAILIAALRAAHAMLQHDAAGRPVLQTVPGPRYERRLARFAFLSPSLQAAIIKGAQAANLTLAKIVRGKLPACWKEQEKWAARRK